jgi:hypothetical protein
VRIRKTSAGPWTWGWSSHRLLQGLRQLFTGRYIPAMVLLAGALIVVAHGDMKPALDGHGFIDEIRKASGAETPSSPGDPAVTQQSATAEMMAILERLRSQGIIEAASGCSRSTVYRFLNKEGLDRHRLRAVATKWADRTRPGRATHLTPYG